ncbi:uncharacterized protein LOC121593738 [Anopheles merus]|uniref:uncharacterized protein LOC121593738 n=1 Tax=Anopheles merus TaxID=30066 RepID=UPI001BE4C6E7|nr:uncharacterized protein LOC121593738 [Anopheles merus]
MSVIIRLQNLPLAANASDVRSFFKGLSIPDGGVHIVGGALGDAFIAFSTDEDARQAMALNGGCIKNEPISLLLSSRAEMQKVIEQARKAALSYMQLKQAATVAAVLPKAAVPVQRPTIPATTTLSPLSVAGSKAAPTASSLAQFNIPPSAKIAAGGTTAPASGVAQQPQPPVISLAGFLAKAAASATVAPTVPAATTVATLSPLLAQGSSYNEIPGLSFLSSDAAADEAGPVMTPLARTTAPTLPSNGGNLSDWLSALNSQAAKAVVPPVAAEMPRPIIVNDQSPWKFLKKDRRSRSRSRSRERSYRRGSRSSSRERDNRRRSRSSSRGRTYNRDADSHSRSSSRERNTRWSRSSSRERRSGRGRRRNSRSRSPSRDRFGRTRQRSRSRSRDRRSHDSNSRDRYDASNGGRSRFSDKNDLEFVALQQQQQQQQGQHSINGGAFAGLNQTMEPIFGLHTGPGGMVDARARFGNNNQQQPNHFSTRSGKISPLPSGNGLNGGFGGMFRNTSPLPESVYSSAKSGAITSDYAVKISNLESVTGYGEIRRFFKSHLITTQGIKMINDQNGRRTGTAYIQFLRKEGKKYALSRDGSAVRRMRVRIESITDQEFDSAVDSYRPGMSHNGKAWDDQNPRNVNPWCTNDYSNEGRNGGGGGRAGSSDVIEIADDRDEPRHDSGRRPPPVAASSALVVWNLPTFTTEQDIMKMFSDFTVVEVLIVKNHHAPKQLDGYVKFHRQEDAQEAWKQVHRHFIGNKKVTVLVCQEIDYEVAKNEHENPRDVEESSSSEQQQQQQQNADGQMERERAGSENGQSEERESVNGSSSGNGGNHSRQGRSSKHGSRWGSVERPWDDDTSENIALKNMMLEAQRRMNAEAAGAANSESNGPWNVLDDRMSRGNSLGNDSDNNGNSNGNQSNEAINNMQIMNFINNMNQMNNNGHGNQQQQQQQGGGNSRDPRRANSRFAPSNDSSEMFQRTNWLLLRNVDFHVYEEDVFAFFGHDGFQAKNVLLVHNERGGRTGECLVEFGSPSEAAHAESKSSQNLGRRKVFASHLDRGQVADLMARFHAIAQGLQPSHWLPDHLRNENSNGGGGSGGGGGGGGGNGGGGGGSQNDDPEKNQGVGCGPYRTSTVGLLNLAYKTTVEDVQKFFQEFNLPLENIRRRFLDNGNATGEAMVRFRNHQDAEKALNEYQNRKLFGRNVRLRLINDD